ncbi:hypothetical protein RchiOBHm_Chr4g0418801 [Rosa chinensis]|uniref:Uncharacterized protein n=1 Tax=Rosa chinensis TaxID=74649 RepID=A0A2P6QXF0_ROSCH|nr:hypothetical protein RchiOBHm_Chr4g0418801 [Rosa chinensis]
MGFKFQGKHMPGVFEISVVHEYYVHSHSKLNQFLKSLPLYPAQMEQQLNWIWCQLSTDRPKNQGIGAPKLVISGGCCLCGSCKGW